LKKIYLTGFFIVAALLLLIPLDKEFPVVPSGAEDSDGKSFTDITNGSDYFIDLKTYPYGYMKMEWPLDAKEARIITEYRTNGFGTGNIHVGYSLGGEWIETGPLGESLNSTIIELVIPDTVGFNKIDFRFRGEDTDFGVDAIAWVNAKMIAKKQVYGLVSLMG
jgi:hypothetical protein